MALRNKKRLKQTRIFAILDQKVKIFIIRKCTPGAGPGFAGNFWAPGPGPAPASPEISGDLARNFR